MRPIRWLHISDLHLHESNDSLQKTVLAAMLSDITKRHKDGLTFDFVLVTGDLAFSGKISEYELVKEFFNQLSSAVGLSRNMIFCVPGNHDIDRERQKMCFAGTRQKLQSQTDVYSFLECIEERETLLMRLSNYHQFQESYFSNQQRELTEYNLGYVSVVNLDEFRIGIMGLNSAWLAEGGQSDHGQLLLGEQQVNSAIKIVNIGNPHIVIGMGHHPFELIRNFDRMPVKRRLEEACHFFHCGHLHLPDASKIASQSGQCLMLAAGASFESRESHNTYTLIAFDPLHALTEVTFVQYNPTESEFSYESNSTYSHEVSATVPCSIQELASALELYCPTMLDVSYYLSALLLGDMSDVPIRIDNAIVFGTAGLLAKQTETKLATTTAAFLTVRRAINLWHGRKSLGATLTDHGAPVATYVEELDCLCKADDGLRNQLLMRNDHAKMLAGADGTGPFWHTSVLLDHLLAEEDWDTLREQAERSCKLNDAAAAAKGKRMLALCLRNSTECTDHERATKLYQELVASGEGVAEDWAVLATLQASDEDNIQAKDTVINAIKTFPQSVDGYFEIGMKIVETTGDMDFRELLLTSKKKRRKA